MLSRRSFIGRSLVTAAAFVAGVRLAIEGAVVDLATPEAHAEVQPCVESTGLRIDPDTLHFEFRTESGWEDTGPVLKRWMPQEYKDCDLSLEPIDIKGFQQGLVNGALAESWKVAACPKKDTFPV